MDKIAALGEKRYGFELGRPLKKGYLDRTLWSWQACLDCGKERWIHWINGKPETQRCRKCASKLRGASNLDYNRKFKSSGGYVLIRLPLNNPFITMSNGGGYLLEHRYIMAVKLGRPLAKSEIVHHKNGIKDDNRIENLELLSVASHRLKTSLCTNCTLSRDIRLLQWQIRELRKQLQGEFK